MSTRETRKQNSGACRERYGLHADEVIDFSTSRFEDDLGLVDAVIENSPLATSCAR